MIESGKNCKLFLREHCNQPVIPVYHHNNDLLNYIATEFGVEAAASIQETFGGESFYIPKRIVKDEKQAYIEKHFGKKSTREIARATGLSVRQVQRRLNWRVSKSQQQLFG